MHPAMFPRTGVGLVAVTVERGPTRPIHPFHAVLLAAALPLFLGGLLSEVAYDSTYQIQWSNFAAWLIAGGMVFTGLALLWALVDLVRATRRRGRPLVYFSILLAVFAFGLIDSFVHARDAWAVMPAGLVLTAITALLAIAATWVGFSGLRGAGE
jgi:uncharacterized membrane protein